jgi:hypothetical protein
VSQRRRRRQLVMHRLVCRSVDRSRRDQVPFDEGGQVGWYDAIRMAEGWMEGSRDLSRFERFSWIEELVKERGW